MPDFEADVEPHQPWSQDGTADVTPKSPFPDTSTVTLPLEHREGGPVTVNRSTYPEGLVVILTDTNLKDPTAVLPMKISSGDTIILPNGEHQSWPEGIVARFTD